MADQQESMKLPSKHLMPTRAVLTTLEKDMQGSSENAK